MSSTKSLDVNIVIGALNRHIFVIVTKKNSSLKREGAENIVSSDFSAFAVADCRSSPSADQS